MPMKTFTLDGYGFEIFSPDDHQLKKFLIDHEKTIRGLDYGPDLMDYVRNSDVFNPKEEFQDLMGLTGSDQGFFNVIADVMAKETLIGFEYHSPGDGPNNVILFPKTYPWLLNSTEKELTEKGLEVICKYYANELGEQSEPTFLSLEYCG